VTNHASGSSVPIPPDPEPFAPYEVVRSRRIYESRWVGLRADDVIFPDGKPGVHHVVEISPAAVVVPVLEDGRIALIGQYRYPIGTTHWEVPAGRIDENEDPLLAAERELREEAGATAREIVRLPGFYAIYGISDHFANVFAALGCRIDHATEHESSERICVKVFTLEEVRALLSSGQILDAFSALALYRYFDLLERSRSTC